MNSPALLVLFDPESWEPTAYLIGQLDVETARLQDLADIMIEAIKEKRP